MLVSVNRKQAERVGGRLRELAWKSAGFQTLNAACPAGLSRDGQVDYFFFTSMLLFDFKGAQAALPDGTVIKGTDVFYRLARQAGEAQADFWTADGLLRCSDDDLRRAFSLTGEAEQPSLSRMDERIAVLRDAARRVKTVCGGTSANLLRQYPRLRGENGAAGLMENLLPFHGYSDPLFKKVFVFLKALDVLDLWHPLDPEHVLMPVDYHVIRLALRNGTVTVEDAALSAALHGGAVVNAAQEQAIREAVMEAYHIMIASAGLSVYFVDEVFWLVGRSCCHYARPPRCGTCDFSECGVQPAFGYTCAGLCPLATTCFGAKDEAYKTLLEPNIQTTFY